MVSGLVSRMALTNLRIVSTFLHTLALFATGFRATYRWRRGIFLWDDTWALVAAALDSILLITLWVCAHIRSRAALGHPPSALEGRTLHMVMSLTFICVIWAARASIACSILRLLPPCRTRKFAVGMIGWFALTWLVLFIQRIWKCGSDKSWKEDCPSWSPVVIEKLSTDILASILLVVVPIFMLWNSTLPKGPCWMIRIVFATSMTGMACSVAQLVYMLGGNRILEGFLAHFEAATTVIICNLLVIVAFCYRGMQNKRDLDEDLSEDIAWRTAPPGEPITEASFTGNLTPSLGGSSLSYDQGSSLLRDESKISSTASHLTVPGIAI